MCLQDNRSFTERSDVMKSEVNLFKRAFGGAMILIMMTAGMIPAALAQEKNQKDRNEGKKRDELKSVYKKWMDEDVNYIITDEERKAFKALKTDEERDQFI